MIGKHVGNYRILRQLGEGGMGTVYEALLEQLGRRVAIKVLRPELSQNPQIVARFFNEARAVNIVRHASIINVFEFGQIEGGITYLVMEYLEGETLTARMQRPSRGGMIDLLRLGRQVASALAAAHEKGIVHRDLKPDNIMIVPDPEAQGGERAKVLDFGIAKLAEEIRRGPQFTGTGALMGTPLYMAPEQCRGAGEVDGRADVYSLGVILYQMLSGQPPFLAAGPGEIMALHMLAAPRPLQQVVPALPEELAQTVLAMLRKVPADRPTMSQAAAGIERLLGTLMNGAPDAGARAAPPAWAVPGGALEPPPPPSTLGRSAGQRGTLPPARRGFLAMLLVGAALAAAGGGRLWWRRDATAGLAMSSPPAPRVRWSISSRPAGAQVVRVADGKVLGTTPWQKESDAASGEMAVELRHPGYVDRPLVLGRGAGVTLDEALVPAPPAPPAPSPPPDRAGERHRKSRSTPKRSKAHREVSNEDIPIVQ